MDVPRVCCKLFQCLVPSVINNIVENNPGLNYVSLLLGSIVFLSSCATLDSITGFESSGPTTQKAFIANEYILTKVIERDANDRLLILETAQLDLDNNEIHYFRESRLDASIQQSKVKYSPDGHLMHRGITDENSVLLRSESVQYDGRNRIQSSIVSERVNDTAAVSVQRFEYDNSRLLRRTVTSSPEANLIESDTYIYLPGGQLDARISQRLIDGQTNRSWARFEYNTSGQIIKRTLGDGNNPGSGVTGYELIDYDDNGNVSAIVRKNADQETTAVRQFEYQHVSERAYNRMQMALAFYL